MFDIWVWIILIEVIMIVFLGLKIKELRTRLMKAKDERRFISWSLGEYGKEYVEGFFQVNRRPAWYYKPLNYNPAADQ